MRPSYPHLRRNFIAFGSDTIFFGIGLAGFLNTNVILPAFTARLGGSTIIVGLVLTLINLAWTLPQFVAGNIVGRFKKKKPIVLATALSGRMFIPAFALLLSLTRGEPPILIFVALCLALMIFLGGDGFATIGWLDMLGRAFPSHKRGSYIAIWQAISSLGILGVALLVGVILGEGGPRFPENYVILFGLASILFLMSALGTVSIFEPPVLEDAAQTAHIPWRDLGPHLLQIWRSDVRLRRLAEARVIFSFAMMAFPFFVLFATQKLGLPDEMLGSFIVAQTVGTMIGGLALGRVADRFGPHRAVQIGAVIIATTPILGLAMSTSTGWPISSLAAIYTWIYICSGLANNILFLGFGNYLLDISPAPQRTIYIGAFNAINSIGVLAPLIAGWLLASTSYTLLFVVTLGFCLVALVMVARLPHARQGETPT
jgi:MFS family permease